MDIILPRYKCYWYEEFPSNLENLLRDAEKYIFQGIVIPIANPLFTREFENETIARNHEIFTRSGTITSHTMWRENILPKVCDTLDCDSSNDFIREHSRRTLEQELKYAEYYRNEESILVRLKSGNVKNLARIISCTLKSSSIIVEVPLVDPAVLKRKWICDGGGDTAGPCGSDTWTWWDNFRRACYPSTHVSLSLDINVYHDEMPSWSVLRRWLGEPVRMINMPSFIFEKNDLNHHVLPDMYDIVFELMKYSVGNIGLKVNYESDEDIQKFTNVVKFLTLKWRIDNMWNSTINHLAEVPQPITVPLTNSAYWKMEKDPVKYRSYQNAIEFALLRRPQFSRQAVLLVGAGRGAMVRAVLNAGKNTQRNLKLYLVEMSEQAVFYLRILKQEMWKNMDMEIILSDIRDYKPPEPIDFIISDLIGGFSDNNFYPELIYPMCEYLKSDGICIPCKITSYINPIMSMLQHYKATKLGWSIYVGTSYDMYNIDEPQSVFEYNFPNSGQAVEYGKYKKLVFSAEQDCNLHGFSGYFECCLYDDVVLSIVPGRFTKGLNSWSLFYFPLEEYQRIKAFDKIEVEFWRCVSNIGMWYEWRVLQPLMTDVHNALGEWWVALKR